MRRAPAFDSCFAGQKATRDFINCFDSNVNPGERFYSLERSNHGSLLLDFAFVGVASSSRIATTVIEPTCLLQVLRFAVARLNQLFVPVFTNHQTKTQGAHSREISWETRWRLRKHASHIDSKFMTGPEQDQDMCVFARPS